MKAFLSRLFRLQPGENKLVFVLGFLLLSNSLARQISDVVAVSGFLSTVGANRILLVWLVDMGLTIALTGLQSLFVDRFNRRSLMKWMCFIYGILLLILRLMFAFHVPSGINYTLLYLLAEQQLLFFPLVFWILANDLLTLAQAKRLFPIIATGNFAGQILGLAIAAIFPTLVQYLGLQVEELLLFNVLIYLSAYVILQTGLSYLPLRPNRRKPENLVATLTEGGGFVREVLSFRYLTFAIVAINICLTIFEFRFLVVSNESFPDLYGYQRFYSLYRLGLIVTAWFVQAFLTSRILEFFSLKNSFFFLPLAQAIASIGMILFPGAVGGIGGFSLSKITQLTVDESARKSIQSLVPLERRGRVSLFMDSYLFATGTIIGCIVTGTIVWLGIRWQTSFYFYVYLAIAVLTSLFTLWSILQMRKYYDVSLLNWRLKRRQRGQSVIDKLKF
jgi:AAA family ATP:ADP antiporter